jgi:hypothetical protein
LPAAMRPLVSTPWIWSKGCCGGGAMRGVLDLGLDNLGLGKLFSADLDEVGVAVEAEDLAAGGGDAEGTPCGLVEESDGGVAYGLEAGEAVLDLGLELGFGGFVCLRGGELDFDVVFLGDAGDMGAGGFEVGGDCDGADEAEVDDVAGEDGVVAVAEREENVGLGEHAGLMISVSRRCWSGGRC